MEDRRQEFMEVDPNDKAAVEAALGRHVYCELGAVENATLRVWRGNSFGYVRELPEGKVVVGPGATLYNWYVEVGDKYAFSPSVYPTPQIAMRSGQAAYDAILAGGQPVVDWSGEPNHRTHVAADKLVRK